MYVLDPFDNYGQNENEMAYCGEACCGVPGRENWGAECCVEDNLASNGAKFRGLDSGKTVVLHKQTARSL